MANLFIKLAVENSDWYRFSNSLIIVFLNHKNRKHFTPQQTFGNQRHQDSTVSKTFWKKIDQFLLNTTYQHYKYNWKQSNQQTGTSSSPLTVVQHHHGCLKCKELETRHRMSENMCCWSLNTVLQSFDCSCSYCPVNWKCSKICHLATSNDNSTAISANFP